MLFYLKNFKEIKKIKSRSIDYDYTYRASSLPPEDYRLHLNPNYHDIYIDSSLRDAEEIALYTAFRYNLNSNREPYEERFGNDVIDKTIDGEPLTKEELEEFVNAWDEVQKKLEILELYFFCIVSAIYVIFLWWYLYIHKIYQKINENKYHILFSGILLIVDFIIIKYISNGDSTLAFLKLIAITALIYFAHRFFYDDDEDDDEYEDHNGIAIYGLKKIKSLSSDFTFNSLFNDMILSSLILIILIPNYAIYTNYSFIVFSIAKSLGFCV